MSEKPGSKDSNDPDVWPSQELFVRFPDIPLERLGLSIRTLNRLNENGASQLGELRDFTARELLRKPGITETNVAELNGVLQSLDYDTLKELAEERGQEHASLLRSARDMLGSKMITGDTPDDCTIGFFIDVGNAPKGVIQDVLECLSDYHRAAGGLGLDFSAEHETVYALRGELQ